MLLGQKALHHKYLDETAALPWGISCGGGYQLADPGCHGQLRSNQLGNRWIGKEKIDAIPVKMDMGTILERTAQAGIRINRPENLTMGSDNIGLCIAFLRVRRANGGGTCALVVLDGTPMSGVGALDIDPYSIESIALLFIGGPSVRQVGRCELEKYANEKANFWVRECALRARWLP